jgi:hypothetical protein
MAEHHKTPSSTTPSTPSLPLNFNPSRMGLPTPLQTNRFPTTYAPTSYPSQYTICQLVPQLTVKQFLNHICAKCSTGPIIRQDPLFQAAPMNVKDYPLCHWCGHDNHWSHLCPNPHLAYGFQECCQVPHSHRNWTASTCTHKDHTTVCPGKLVKLLLCGSNKSKEGVML